MRRFASPTAAVSYVAQMDVAGPVAAVPLVKAVTMLEPVRLVFVRLIVSIKHVDRMVAASFVDNVHAAPYATRIPGPARPYVCQAAQIKTVVVMGVAAPVASVPQV